MAYFSKMGFVLSVGLGKVDALLGEGRGQGQANILLDLKPLRFRLLPSHLLPALGLQGIIQPEK